VFFGWRIIAHRVGRIGSSNRFNLQTLFDALAAAHQQEAEQKMAATLSQ
jgi:hypothetical protein